jgi:cytochrome b involved in lipid metabolism
MKKVVLVFIILFWTFYVAIVSIGVYDNFFGIKDTTQSNSNALNNQTDILLDEAEVAKHNKVGDCWSIIGGKVYNLTAYLDKHPARADTILPYCGTKGDKGYSTKDKIIAKAHSAFADTLLAKYLIGDLGQTIKANSQGGGLVNDGPDLSNGNNLSQNNNSTVVLSFQEVSKHTTSSDCWMTINNKVYNITSYFGAHPGGNNRLLAYCGKDATAAFSGLPHSVYAGSLLQKYFIGSLGSTASINNNQSSQNNNNNNVSVTPQQDENEVEDYDEEDN